MNIREEDEGHQMFFVRKTDLLNNVSHIYDSLLDITSEIESTKESINKMRDETHNLRMNIRHLKSILQKDLAIRSQTKDTSINLNAIKMSLEEWDVYINRSRGVSNAEKGHSSDNTRSI